jgi:hypothetical protein
LLYRLSRTLGHIEIPGVFALTVSRRNKDTMKKRFVDVLWLSVFLLAMAFSRPLYADSPALEYLKTNLTSVQQALFESRRDGAYTMLPSRVSVWSIITVLSSIGL